MTEHRIGTQDEWHAECDALLKKEKSGGPASPFGVRATLKAAGLTR